MTSEPTAPASSVAHAVTAPPTSLAATRRHVVAMGAAGLATSLLGLTAAAAQDAPATIVLMHGAWAGAWIWRDVVAALREAGYAVYTVTATGMGDRTHLADSAINLTTHVTDVVNLIEYEDLHDVHLVGWSYGGLVITGVAEVMPERLAQLIYLDAAAPLDGQTGYEAEMYPDAAIAVDIRSGIEAGWPGFFTWEPATAWLEANTSTPEALAWIEGKLTPQSMLTYLQPNVVQNPAAAELLHSFIYCTEEKGDATNDHTVRTLERVRDEPNWRVVELADTHLAPLNDPLAVAETIAALVDDPAI